jgi:N-acetylglutamate synthase-like GNAT family acetyltransferase
LTRKPIAVRKAVDSDESALALVYRTAFSAGPYKEKWTDATARLRVRQLIQSIDGKGWVVTLYGHPIGFAFLQMKEGFNGRYGELVETAVHPYLQRQGMGSLLFQEVLKFKKKAKLHTLYGVTLNRKLGSFFKKFGFKPSSRAKIWSKT